MACLRNPTPAIQRTFFLNPSFQVGVQSLVCIPSFRRSIRFLVKAAAASPPAPPHPDRCGRRKALALGTFATCISILNATATALAVESKKGFNAVLDKKDGYSFLYPFGWQEVVIEGQDKVLKDVIEPLESVSINLVETSKQNIKDLGTPQQVAEALIKKVLAPPSQKTKLIEAAEHEADGKTYYTFEFVAQAPNYTRHALGAIGIGNGSNDIYEAIGIPSPHVPTDVLDKYQASFLVEQANARSEWQTKMYKDSFQGHAEREARHS